MTSTQHDINNMTHLRTYEGTCAASLIQPAAKL